MFETEQSNFIYIPDNEVISEEGYFSKNGFVDLLRKYYNNPEAVHFLADMLEE